MNQHRFDTKTKYLTRNARRCAWVLIASVFAIEAFVMFTR